MEIVYVLVPLSLLLAGFFIAGFIWMTKKGQYDDLDTPSLRMLLDDVYKPEKTNAFTKERKDYEQSANTTVPPKA